MIYCAIVIDRIMFNVENNEECKKIFIFIRPYYEMKAHFNQVLEEQKIRVSALEKSVADAKMSYAGALRNLERISDEIHRVSSCGWIIGLFIVIRYFG